VPDSPGTIHCARCGQELLRRSARCWRCGLPVTDSLQTHADGLGTLSKALVIFAVFVVALFGMSVLGARQAALVARSSPRAEPSEPAAIVARATPLPTALPRAKPGTYVVQGGESLFSLAQATGIDANLLVFWNVARYPTLASTPALERGWILRLTGPRLPTQRPEPTQPPQPQPTQPTTALTAIPNVYSRFFAGGAVVHTYAIYGTTLSELISSIRQNGPYSAWLGSDAEAHVETTGIWQFHFLSSWDGGCDVVPDASPPVSLRYVVVMPRWVPPKGVSAYTVTWWATELLRAANHENHHIKIYQSFLPALNSAVVGGTCTSVSPTITSLMHDAAVQQCTFDLQQYGYAQGLTVQGCLAKT
jgi:predicted secreted Zn-dependent protease